MNQAADLAIARLEEIAEVASRDELPRLIGDVERVKSALLARLMTAPAADDRLLTAEEAAPILGIGISTLYQENYPFTVRPTKGTVRFSWLGIQKYLAKLRGARQPK